MTANNTPCRHGPGDLKQYDVIGLIEQGIDPDEADIFRNPTRLLSNSKGLIYTASRLSTMFPENLIQIIMRDIKVGCYFLPQRRLPAAGAAQDMYFHPAFPF